MSTEVPLDAHPVSVFLPRAIGHLVILVVFVVMRFAPLGEMHDNLRENEEQVAFKRPDTVVELIEEHGYSIADTDRTVCESEQETNNQLRAPPPSLDTAAEAVPQQAEHQE